MSRKPVQRTLPPLSKQLPYFSGFERGQNKTQGLKDALRTLASRSRGSRAKPFYAMREVAAFFGVDVKTAAVAYRQLEREGLLLRKRSSVTELTPRKGVRRIIHRGIVAIPVWLVGFLAFRDWRLFFIELEGQLRQRGFVANLIFCAQGEDPTPGFAERVLSHEPDYVVWLAPAGCMQSSIATIAEAGVRMVILNNSPDLDYRDQRYLLTWESGLRTGLAAWKRRGIHTVEIPRNNGPVFSSIAKIAEQMVRESGLTCLLPMPREARMSDYIAGLGRDKGIGVMLDEEIWCSMLCAQAPHDMAALIKRATVLALRPLNIPPPYLIDARLDWLAHDWRAIASRVAEDIGKGRIFSSPSPVLFEAEWNPSVAATELATHFGNVASE